MVPKLALIPLALDAAIAIACAVCVAFKFNKYAQPTAAPKTPKVAVGCQPFS